MSKLNPISNISYADKYDFRDAVFGAIEILFKNDPNIIVLTNDLGALGLDRLSSLAPERVINVGITEQNLISVAAGLASNGKKVFVYAIISHVVLRAFEQIKLDVCIQKLPVFLIGVGAGLAYGVDGPTHHAIDDINVLRILPNFSIYNPADVVSARESIYEAYRQGGAAIIRVDKEVLPELYSVSNSEFSGVLVHRQSEIFDGVIITTGVLVWEALDAQRRLNELGIPTVVINLILLKPLNFDIIVDICAKAKWIKVIEESVESGSLSENLALIFLRNKIYPKSYDAINFADTFLMGVARRDAIWSNFGMTSSLIVESIQKNK